MESTVTDEVRRELSGDALCVCGHRRSQHREIDDQCYECECAFFEEAE